MDKFFFDIHKICRYRCAVLLRLTFRAGSGPAIRAISIPIYVMVME